ncbi:MAG: hypothetical protein EPO26_03625 [Chloroflexota bacterium]|nr:MAG: hypothetical protein EPO26_03625 [Chloroflexota bacterium]
MDRHARLGRFVAPEAWRAIDHEADVGGVALDLDAMPCRDSSDQIGILNRRRRDSNRQARDADDRASDARRVRRVSGKRVQSGVPPILQD